MEQLNKLFCAQSHLEERFTEIVDNPAIADLRDEVAKSIQEIGVQLSDTLKIYTFLNREHSFALCDKIVFMLEDDFDNIQKNIKNSRSRDLAFINYIQNIQNLISAAFQMIQLKKGNLDEKIDQLISQNATVEPALLLKKRLLNRLRQPSS